MRFDGLRWRKSSHSSENACVELAPAAPLVAARDSKRPAQPHLAVQPRIWARFANGVKTGRFDLA